MIFLLLVAALPIRPFTSHGGQKIYPAEIGTDAFQIVDASFSKGVIAFRHVYHINQMAKSCEYAALKGLPTSGLTYGIYDLKEDKLMNAFTVLASTYGECTDEKTAAVTQRHYEAKMAELGLDPKKAVITLPIPPPQNGVQTFALTSKSKSLKMSAENLRRSEEQPPNECGNTPQVSEGRVQKEGKTIWVRCQQDMINATMGGSFVYPLAIVIGKKAVLVEKFSFATHEVGYADREIWSFTKVFNL